MNGIDVTERGRLVILAPAGEAKSLVSAQALHDLSAFCDAVATEERVLVVVLVIGASATGPADATHAHGIHDALTKATKRLANTPHVTIAALDGNCIDHELCLAIACDLRVAASDVQIGFPGVATAVVPDELTVRRLTTMVGRTRAADLLLTGRTIVGTSAADWGLVEEAAEEETAVARAEVLARVISDGAPLAMRYAKEAVDRGYRMRLDEGLGLEGDLYAILQTTADRMEGISAFQARRGPRYVGK